MVPLLKGIHDGYKFLIMNFTINFCRRKIMKIEANKMKKIVFSKLWKHNTYCKVENVHFQDKRFGKVYMNQ